MNENLIFKRWFVKFIQQQTTKSFQEVGKKKNEWIGTWMNEWKLEAHKVILDKICKNFIALADSNAKEETSFASFSFSIFHTEINNTRDRSTAKFIKQIFSYGPFWQSGQ